MRTITECQLAYEECMEKSRDYEDLPLAAKNYYDQAQVYEYIVIKLKEVLK